MGPASTATPPTKQGGGAAVIIGVILLLGAAGGILWYVRREDPKPVTPTPSVSASEATTAPPTTTLDLPPIPIETDAGADTGEKPKPATTGTGGGGGSGGCACTQGGTPNADLAKAANARGGTAKQCYKAALEGNEGLQGTVTAQVLVGTNGEACSVTIVSDTTGSSKLQQCVKQKLGIGGYPKPSGGCVAVKVPVVFTTQH
jgi:hypothetical protein